jgi:hypothetical protein
MFEGFGKKKETPTVEGMDAENVVPMVPGPEKPGIIVRDSLGNVVGNAATPEEAKRMQREANVSNREAA